MTKVNSFFCFSKDHYHRNTILMVGLCKKSNVHQWKKCWKYTWQNDSSKIQEAGQVLLLIVSLETNDMNLDRSYLSLYNKSEDLA